MRHATILWGQSVVIVVVVVVLVAGLATNLRAADDGGQQLRAMGPRGLAMVLERYDAQIRDHQNDDPEWKRISALIDAVAGQKDAYASRLYWYTDFDAAKSAARESGKPILSLRLLGNLDTELSCANSRFFRTTLYCNTEVSNYLRENFVLHWKSVRPVPKITIDFGDGRKIERTITGNSIHYILTPDGRPIDAMPGLYSPAAFVRGLKSAQAAALDFAKNPNEQRLRAYHTDRLAAIQGQMVADMKAVGAIATVLAAPPQGAAVPAAKADLRTATKSFVERPMVRGIAASPIPAIDDALWAEIAALHAENATLDQASLQLIRAKHPSAREAGKRAVEKRLVEDPMLRVIANLRRSIAEDTVRNEYMLHPRLHEWFIASVGPMDLETLNERVYAELFLTPSSDPWLGLAPDDAFAAIEGGGRTQ